MCPESSNCTRKHECYRYMAIADVYQAYMNFENICNEENSYKWFWSIDGKKVREVKEVVQELDVGKENT